MRRMPKRESSLIGLRPSKRRESTSSSSSIIMVRHFLSVVHFYRLFVKMSTGTISEVDI